LPSPVALRPSSFCSYWCMRCTRHICPAVDKVLPIAPLQFYWDYSQLVDLSFDFENHLLLGWHFHVIYSDLSLFLRFNLLSNVFIWEHWFCLGCSLSLFCLIYGLALFCMIVSVAIWITWQLFCTYFVSVVVWYWFCLKSQLWFVIVVFLSCGLTLVFIPVGVYP
jgi:hypothetical protein